MEEAGILGLQQDLQQGRGSGAVQGESLREACSQHRKGRLPYRREACFRLPPNARNPAGAVQPLADGGGIVSAFFGKAQGHGLTDFKKAILCDLLQTARGGAENA